MVGTRSKTECVARCKVCVLYLVSHDIQDTSLTGIGGQSESQKATILVLVNCTVYSTLVYIHIMISNLKYRLVWSGNFTPLGGAR